MNLEITEENINNHPDRELIRSVLQVRPDVTFRMTKHCVYFTQYRPSVRKSLIVFDKSERSVYKSTHPEHILNMKYLTELEAREVIAPVYIKAIEKFKECIAAKQELHARLGFNSGVNYDGDVHGIYNEYEYVSFEMDGFHFEFDESDVEDL